MKVWSSRHQKKVPPSCPAISGKWLKSVKTEKNSREIQDSKHFAAAEMTGDSCLARTVVLRTAAAVDHADTELIGQERKQETPGFFVVFLSEILLVLQTNPLNF